MDLAIYAAQKAAGVAKLVPLGPATVGYLAPQFDPNTGAQLPSQVNQFNLQGLDDAITAKQAELDALTSFRADAAAVLAAQPVQAQAVAAP